MSDEFSIDIDKALESAKTNDLAGLDKKMMGDIADGEYNSYDCYDSTGRHYTKIVIEYEEPKTR